MIGVAVADEGDFDLRRIEAQRLEAGQELRLHLVGAERIDHQ